MDPLVQKVEAELARYEHPLFRFSTEDVGSGVLLAIDLREELGVRYHYEITLQAREIENRERVSDLDRNTKRFREPEL